MRARRANSVRPNHAIRHAIEPLEQRMLLAAELVMDINQIGSSSSSQNFVDVNGTLFFSADDGIHGRELWASDANGTHLVKDLIPGGVGGDPGGQQSLYSATGGMAAYQGQLLFSARSSTGYGLWKSDGTEAGTVLITAMPQPVTSGFVEMNGQMYFATSYGFWKTDGTAAGTVQIKTVSYGYYVSNICVANSSVYFLAFGELWRSDGTEAGTGKVTPVAGPITNIYSFQNQLYFTTRGYSYPYSSALWRGDGTAAGSTQLLADNLPDESGGVVAAVVGDHLYWAALTGIWRIDSGGGTVKLVGNGDWGNPRGLTAAGDLLFFRANSSTTNFVLYKSDGSDAGTVPITTFASGWGRQSMAAWGQRVVFDATDATAGLEPHVSDGTPSGTRMLADVNQATLSSKPIAGLVVNGLSLFIADDGIHGQELWTSDGTAEGTRMVLDFSAGSASASLALVASMGTYALFLADDYDTGRELWVTDGTAAGTRLLKDIYRGFLSSSPALLGISGGTVYFSATDGTRGRELWKSDGTEAGTVLVKDILPGATGSLPQNAAVLNGKLYFSAADGVNGRELWTSDGTDSGTLLVKDIYAGSLESAPAGLTVMDGQLYFSAKTGTQGIELWKSDGTAAGTMLIKDLNPGIGDGSPANFAVVDGTLFFSGTGGSSGIELWKTNGTATGTVCVRDIAAGSWSSSPDNLKNVGGTLFFLADDGVHGRQLWTSGTAAGTYAVRNFSTTPTILGVVSETLYLTADDGSGAKLYCVRAGSALVLADDGGASALVSVLPGGDLLLSATHYPYGQELFRLAPLAVPLVAEAGGPYFASEGSTVVLDSYGSSGLNAKYEWDFDYDGTFNIDAVGARYVIPTNLVDGPAYRAVALRVTDAFGKSAIDTASLRIVNVFPFIKFSMPSVVDEGTVFSLNMTVVDPGPDTISRWVIDWGDGTTQTVAGGISSVTHSYPDDPATHTVTATVTDDDGIYTCNVGTITVRNVAPRVLFGALPYVSECAPYDVIFSVSDPGQDTIVRYTMYWGDGTSTSGDGIPTSLSHTYSDGTMSLYPYLALTDEDGTFNTNMARLTVENLAPTASFDGPSTGAEGAPITLVGSATDPSPVDQSAGFTYFWSIATNGWSTLGIGKTFTFTPVDNGTYSVIFYAKDKDNCMSQWLSKTIVVSNVAPTAVIYGAPEVIDEGSVINLRAGASDPASNDGPFSYEWTVQKDGQPFATSTSYDLSINAADNATYVVTLTAKDKDGATSAPTTKTIEVRNAAPRPTFWNLGPVDEGSTASLRLFVTDPGDDTLTQWQIDWGDGTIDVFPGNTTYFTHVYRDGPASFTVSATATDEDGSYVFTAGTVDVFNVAPRLSFGRSTPIDEGSYATFIIWPSDKGMDTVTEWVIDWGDGTTTSGETAGKFYHLYADGPAACKIVVTATDEDGSYVFNAGTIDVINVAPVAYFSSPPPVSSTEGQVIRAWSSAYDVGTTDAAAGLLFDWSVTKAGTLFASGVGNELSFTPDDEGVYLVRVTATDKDGGVSAVVEKSATVINAAPSGRMISTPGVEGTASVVQLVNVVDAPADMGQLRYSFDFNDDGDYSDPGDVLDSTSPTASFTFADNGTYVVRGRITDGDGGVFNAWVEVYVENKPPVVSISGPTSGKRNSWLTFVFTASDVPADMAAGFTYSIDWEGDGWYDTAINGGESVTAQFRYRGAGTYNLWVCVTDKDGSVTRAVLPVVIG